MYTNKIFFGSIKRISSFVLAITMLLIFPSEYAQSADTRLAYMSADAAMTPSSGTVRLDQDEDKDKIINGDYVFIYNKNTDYETSQSTGTLDGIDTRAPLSLSPPENATEPYEIPYHPHDPNDAITPPAPLSLGVSDLVQSYNNKSKPEYILNQTKTFYIDDTEAAPEYKEFTLYSIGEECYVWVDTLPNPNYGGLSIDQEDAKKIALSYDGMADDMKNNFGDYYDADGSGKVHLLIYDIKDKFNPPTNYAYKGGYFWSGDLFPSYNETQMLHIDTYPGIIFDRSKDIKGCFSVLVHELQHLINYSKYFEHLQTNGNAASMDTWLNEALSMAAEESIEEGSAVNSRINSYLNGKSDFANGRSIYDFNKESNLNGYALSGLFSKYLSVQTGSYNVFSRIIDYYGNRAVKGQNNEKNAIELALKDDENLKEMSLEELIATYRISLLTNDDTGLYGFEKSSIIGTNPFNNKNLHIDNYLYRSTAPVELKGGASIVVRTVDGKFSIPNGAGSDIEFIGIRTGVKVKSVVIGDKPAQIPETTRHIMSTNSTPQQLSVVVDPVDFQNNVTWGSTDPTVASVDQTGKLTAHKIGQVTISATADGMSDSFVLQVNASDKGVVITNKPTGGMSISDTHTLTAVTYPNPAQAVKWSSDNTAVATIDAAGVIKAISAGAVNITCTLDDGSTESDSFFLRVIDPSEPHQLSLSDGHIKITSAGFKQSKTIADIDSAPLQTPLGGRYEIAHSYTGKVPAAFDANVTTAYSVLVEGYSGHITLSGVNIDTTQNGSDGSATALNAAFKVTGQGKPTVFINKQNSLTSTGIYAGLSVNEGEGEITIDGTRAENGWRFTPATFEGYSYEELTPIPDNRAHHLLTVEGLNGAGIGGDNLNNNGKITIVGGTINAVSATGAGIGGGHHSVADDLIPTKITITGNADINTKTIANGAGIGGGGNLSNFRKSPSQIEISGQAIVKAIGTACSTGIGAGGYQQNIAPIGENTILIKDYATVFAKGGNHGPGIGAGCSSRASGITINMARTPEKNDADRRGTVVAIGALGAGIGGGAEVSNHDGVGENININGGTVHAFSTSGSGIGGGSGFAGNNITLNGGNVTAVSTTGGSGIGSGSGGSATNINITGGTVTAKGGSNGSGIGGGMAGSATGINITGGIVLAQGGTNGSGIGGGSATSGTAGSLTGLVIKDNAVVNAYGGDYGVGIGGGNLVLAAAPAQGFTQEAGSATGIVISDGSHVTAISGSGSSGIGGGNVIVPNDATVSDFDTVKAGALDLTAENNSLLRAYGESAGIGAGIIITADGTKEFKPTTPAEIILSISQDTKVYAYSLVRDVVKNAEGTASTLTGRPAIDMGGAKNAATPAGRILNFQLYEDVSGSVPVRVSRNAANSPIWNDEEIFLPIKTADLPLPNLPAVALGYNSFAFTIPSDEKYNVNMLHNNNIYTLVEFDPTDSKLGGKEFINNEIYHPAEKNVELKPRPIVFSPKPTDITEYKEVAAIAVVKQVDGTYQCEHGTVLLSNITQISDINCADCKNNTNINSKFGTVTGRGKFAKDFTISVNAINNRDNYKFFQWLDPMSAVPDFVSFVPTYGGLKLDKDRILWAEYEPVTKPTTFKVKAVVEPSDLGTIVIYDAAGNVCNDDTIFASGDKVRVKITPRDEKVKWLGLFDRAQFDPDSGKLIDIMAPLVPPAEYEFFITADTQLTAKFALPQVKVKLVADPELGGTVAFSDDAAYATVTEKIIDVGGMILANAKPNAGFTFESWTVFDVPIDGSKSRAVGDLTIDPVVTDIVATAHFKAIPTPPPVVPPVTPPTSSSSSPSWILDRVDSSDSYEPDTERLRVTLDANPSGGGTLQGAGQYDERNTVTIKATAHYGYEFSHWISESGARINANPYSFTIYRDKHFTAVFLPTSAPKVVNPSTGGLGKLIIEKLFLSVE